LFVRLLLIRQPDNTMASTKVLRPNSLTFHLSLFTFHSSFM
jgi:hypothetical protein